MLQASLAHSILVADTALALPNFDDPNIDKDEAIAGVLGICFLPVRLRLPQTLF